MKDANVTSYPRTASYILMTYNQETTVAAAVQSALDQDGPALEIIISDDASQDRTFEIIEKVLAGYSGPHAVKLNRNSENLGLAAHFAKMHALSTGEVIINAAGDDVSQPQRSQRIMDAFCTATPPMLVCSRASTIDPNGKPVADSFATALFHHAPDLLQVARSKRLYLGATGAWDRSVYETFGPIEDGAYEDLVLGFRAMLLGDVRVIDEDLVTYRLGGLSTSEALTATQDDLRENRQRSLQTIVAVMRQRQKDATTFGLDTSSPVWRILQKAEHKARAALAYWDSDIKALAKHIGSHPILALGAIYSERRKIGKLRKRVGDTSVPSS